MNVKLQSKSEYCLIDCNSGDPKFNIKPDIVVEYEDNKKHIIDTKWKPIAPIDSDVWKSVKSGDIYQLMTYGEIYKSDRVSLLYPHNNNLKSGEGLQQEGEIFTNPGRRLEIVSFDVSIGTDELKRIENFLLRKDSFHDTRDY